jgi:hypothetical protein
MPDLLSIPLHDLNLPSFLDFPKYFNFMLLQGGVIHEILALLKIWKDPKLDNTMYQKNLFKDWTSSHLRDCPWYVDCPKDNTPLFEWELQEKLDPRYVECLASSKMEAKANNKKKV